METDRQRYDEFVIAIEKLAMEYNIPPTLLMHIFKGLFRLKQFSETDIKRFCNVYLEYDRIWNESK